MAAETRSMSGPLVPPRPDRSVRRGTDVAHVVLRFVSLLTSVTALSLMVSAKEAGNLSIYGFRLPVSSKWSFSDSFE